MVTGYGSFEYKPEERDGLQNNRRRQRIWPNLFKGRWLNGFPCVFERFQTILKKWVGNAH